MSTNEIASKTSEWQQPLDAWHEYDVCEGIRTRTSENYERTPHRQWALPGTARTPPPELLQRGRCPRRATSWASQRTPPDWSSRWSARRHCSRVPGHWHGTRRTWSKENLNQNMIAYSLHEENKISFLNIRKLYQTHERIYRMRSTKCSRSTSISSAVFRRGITREVPANFFFSELFCCPEFLCLHWHETEKETKETKWLLRHLCKDFEIHRFQGNNEELTHLLVIWIGQRQPLGFLQPGLVVSSWRTTID